MKVIRNGTEGWTKEVSCYDCGSDLEIESEDVRIRKLGTEHRLFVSCPVCSSYLDLENLPLWVIRAAFERCGD